MIIYCITDGAPTTERGMPTTITTYKMLEYVDQTLTSMKLPRKTIGFNVTQIGMHRERVFRKPRNHTLIRFRRCCHKVSAGIGPAPEVWRSH